MDLSKILIRDTNDGDFNDIMEVEKKAFGYDKEAQLVADLLNDKTAEPYISLLAFDDGKAVGHILFTRVHINEITNKPLFHILAPLAVKPEWQKRGIGGMLIYEGLNKLKEIGSEMVFVLGHIGYYPKFGFITDAKSQGYTAPFPIPEEYSDAWMVQTLTEEGKMINPGQVICAKELNKPEHWRE